MPLKCTVSDKIGKAQQAEIETLAAARHKENGLYFKLDPGSLNGELKAVLHILCREENGPLVAYALLYPPGDNEREVTVVCTESEEAFAALHTAIIEEMPSTMPLFIADENDTFLVAQLRALAYSLRFEEDRMEWEGKSLPAASGAAPVALRKATAADAKTIARLNAIGFGNAPAEEAQGGEEAEEPPAPDPGEQGDVRMIEAEGEVVGKINLYFSDGLAGVYGFVLQPQHRGKGFGRAALCQSLAILQGQGAKLIYLEVLTDNEGAIHLYESTGFARKATYAYYG